MSPASRSAPGSGRSSPGPTAARGSASSTRSAAHRARGRRRGFRSTATELRLPATRTIGPDGQAWFSFRRLGRCRRRGPLARRRRTGCRRRRARRRADATGPDGILWATRTPEEPGLARGSRRRAPSRRRRSAFRRDCTTRCFRSTMSCAPPTGQCRASDPWCDRLVRVAPDGTSSVVEADPTWPPRSSPRTPSAASGLRPPWTRVRRPRRCRRPRDPHPERRVGDRRLRGAGRRRLVRAWAVRDRAPERRRARAPAHHDSRAAARVRSRGRPVAGQPQARLVHAPVDALARQPLRRPPPRRVRRGSARRVSLAALRRGLRVSVREPAMVSAYRRDEPSPLTETVTRDDPHHARRLATCAVHARAARLRRAPRARRADPALHHGRGP